MIWKDRFKLFSLFNVLVIFQYAGFWKSCWKSLTSPTDDSLNDVSSLPEFGGKRLSPAARSTLRFPNEAAALQMRDMEDRTHTNKTEVNETDESAFSKLQLFVPAFPGGFQEFQTTLIRSLEFFWPLDRLNIMVALDKTVYNTTRQRDQMTQKVYSFFRKEIPVTVAYNPLANKTLYADGWNIQQLIMFWADNFTDAEYIGFVDDDTLFSRAVLPQDLFDRQGRPRVLAKYPSGPPKKVRFYEWHQASHWALGTPSFINAMAYFPVILRRHHLQEIREAMLLAHPNFACFDDLFLAMIRSFPLAYSQFMIMFDYLWLHHQEDYEWHLTRDQTGSHAAFPDGYPHDYNFEGYGFPQFFKTFAIAQGSLEELGITPAMLKPVPRVAVHAGFIPQGFNRKIRIRRILVDEILARGYCFSQPLNTTWQDATFMASCLRFFPNVTDDVNERCEWTFELAPFWVNYDYEGAQQAHWERMQQNVPRDWDIDELRTVLRIRNRRIEKQAEIQCEERSILYTDTEDEET